MRRRGLMFWKEKLPPLPDGYTRLKYVENTGSAYIVPVEYITGNTSVECEAMRIGDGGNTNIFGGLYWFLISNYARSVGIEAGTQSNNTVIQHGCTRYNCVGTISGMPEIGKTVYLYASLKKGILKDTSNHEWAFKSTATYFGQTQIKFGLFCRFIKANYNNVNSFDWRTENFFKGRIYYFNMWEGDVQIRALVPAKRDSDDMIGMYDTINGVFYEPQGGQLIGGGNLTAKFLSVIKHLFKKGGAA